MGKRKGAHYQPEKRIVREEFDKQGSSIPDLPLRKGGAGKGGKGGKRGNLARRLRSRN